MTDPGLGFRQAVEGFDAALRQAPDRLVERWYAVAGRPVRLRVIGAALAEEVDLPLRHLRLEAPVAGDPEVTIDIWDSDAAGTPPVLGELAGPAGPYGQVTLSDDGRYCGEQRDHAALWFDRNDRRMVGCTAGMAQRALDERARPFHKYFSIWLAGLGIQCIHAGLASRDGQGLLFVGSGGTGKTTSSISCFLGGIGYLGDDFVAIEQGPDGRFQGHGLYGSCLVNSQHLKRFPALDAVALPPHHDYEEKSVVYMAPLGLAQIEATVPIAGVVMPRVVGTGDTLIRPARKAEALLRMAPSSIMSLPIVVDGALERLAALLDTVPCFWLELGTDVDRIPDAVQSIFDRLGQASAAATA